MCLADVRVLSGQRGISAGVQIVVALSRTIDTTSRALMTADPGRDRGGEISSLIRQTDSHAC